MSLLFVGPPCSLLVESCQITTFSFADIYFNLRLEFAFTFQTVVYPVALLWSLDDSGETSTKVMAQFWQAFGIHSSDASKINMNNPFVI